MAELWLDNGRLVSEAAWREQMQLLRSQSGVSVFSEVEAIPIVQSCIKNAISSRIPTGPFSIMFSGGLDSSTIAFCCKQLGAKFGCISVGMEGSADLAHARITAQELGLSYRERLITPDELEPTLVKVGRLLSTDNVVQVSVGAVSCLAMEMAKGQPVFTGLGSEEIFAGYQRHAESRDITLECWNGLEAMWQRDLRRDYAISKALGCNVMTPFLDKELIKAAMSISPELKINRGRKKYILMAAASKMGLGSAAQRPKKASQYGSGIDKGLEKLAHSKGFRHKSDYLANILGI